LLTARHAEEQGRAVYALPGNVGNVNSELSNILIKNGAKLCMSADDIIRDFEDSSSGILNPFLLSQTKSVDVYEELKKYSVSAVTSNDRVFRRPYRSSAKVSEAEGAEIQPKIDPVEVSRTMDGFDAETLKVYKKIPQGEECTIESLVDSELSLRKVMKALLRLEVGHFIVMCPGEKCKRNF
jgi:predicted Rossmann fold nucleotide-binding protein DprA/Smf involved in DNA uptake